MNPTVYEIRTYDLIGKIINVYNEREDLTFEKSVHRGDLFFDKEGNRVEPNRHFELTTSLENYKNLLKLEDFPIYLPYFADVTEDLPVSCRYKGEPKTWKRCQLLTQKHGGYLEFFHHESGETLRIAINSNTYSPCV